MNTTSIITDAQKQQYQEEGYFILERVIPDDHLQLLQEACQQFIDLVDEEMEQQGVEVLGLNRRNNRYFITQPSLEEPRLLEFLFSDLMADIARAALGPDVWLFYEQYVVKAAEQGMKFGWHQDSGYVNAPHKPYLSCWCALDDMSEANGTIYVLPYSRAGGREVFEHVQEEGSNDLIGYSGDDPGVPVIVPAGSIAIFSSVTLHRSGYNTTDKMRRSYLAQYSSELLLNTDGQPRGRSERFLKNGRRVTDIENVEDVQV
ncbi:MAG: phytanoyl-CoA dioxygenase family protein [Abitibacteriaceae bacterium]|nr:phytanoyl-CoA dioxygenase family protein [Abditibacteriaceae bacterium]MBV9868627.1 phytanoyl-CoA dioxygenase family protein [Abditibacteriaceae bacterium]